MPEPHLRRFATSLLRLGIRIAPQETAEWGHAMLSEMNQVEGNWAALLWSFGGAGVLAKHAVLSLIFPSRKGSATSSGELFAKEGPIRKTTLAVIAGCGAVSLLFFLAPVFRQAFRFSLAPWYYFMCSVMTNGRYQPRSDLEAIARLEAIRVQ